MSHEPIRNPGTGAPGVPGGPQAAGSAAPAASAAGSNVVQYDDFVKLDLRVGTVTQASDHPKADKLLVLKVDMGGGAERQIVAGLRGYYDAASLVGKQIIIVANLAPRVMRGLESQGMLLAASTDDRAQVIVLSPERSIAPGSKVS